MKWMDLREVLRDSVGPVLFFHGLMTFSDKVQWVTLCGEVGKIAKVVHSISTHRHYVQSGTGPC